MQIYSDYIVIENRKYLVQITLLDEQLFLVITDRTLQLNNLYVAMQTKYEQLPTVVTVQDSEGREDENQILTLARSICKKNKKHLIFSYNIEQQIQPEFYLGVNKQLSLILKRIFSDIGDQKEYEQLLQQQQQQQQMGLQMSQLPSPDQLLQDELQLLEQGLQEKVVIIKEQKPQQQDQQLQEN